MRRRTFDFLMAGAGLVVAIVLIVAGVLLLWAHSFIDDNVHSQLAAQKIFFPSKAAIAAQNNPDITKYITPYADQQLVNGKQAQVFADHYIANHLKEVADGQTYSQVSEKFITMKPSDPFSPCSTTRMTVRTKLGSRSAGAATKNPGASSLLTPGWCQRSRSIASAAISATGRPRPCAR